MSEQLRRIQALLILISDPDDPSHNFADGLKADGEEGPATEKCLRAYQEYARLRTTGKADDVTTMVLVDEVRESTLYYDHDELVFVKDEYEDEYGEPDDKENDGD